MAVGLFLMAVGPFLMAVGLFLMAVGLFLMAAGAIEQADRDQALRLIIRGGGVRRTRSPISALGV